MIAEKSGMHLQTFSFLNVSSTECALYNIFLVTRDQSGHKLVRKTNIINKSHQQLTRTIAMNKYAHTFILYSIQRMTLIYRVPGGNKFRGKNCFWRSYWVSNPSSSNNLCEMHLLYVLDNRRLFSITQY